MDKVGQDVDVFSLKTGDVVEANNMPLKTITTWLALQVLIVGEEWRGACVFLSVYAGRARGDCVFRNFSSSRS